jgi:hypothetical protein
VPELDISKFTKKPYERPEGAAYAHQLAQYVHVLRAKRGAIVYMTTGKIPWVESAKVATT